MIDEILLPLIPHHVLARILAEGRITPGITKTKSVLLYTDISGFTALTEALTAEGKQGIEEVTEILNAHFSRLSKILEDQKGSLLKLGGDSLLARFDDQDAVKRGTATAWEMLDWLKENPIVKTSKGNFTLSMKAILGGGDYYEAILGDDEKVDWFPLGDSVEELAMAEKSVGPGELVVRRGLGDETFDKAPFLEINEEDRQKLVGLTKSFLPLGNAGKSALSKGGEYRIVAPFFLNLEGYDSANPDFESLNSFYLNILKIVRRYQGAVNKVDISPRGSKFLILFGAPLSHETDRANAAACFKDIYSFETSFVLTGGLSYGAAFAGYIGGQEKEYTVIGQRVNAAAKIMSASEPGQFVVTEEARDKFSDLYETEELAPVSVRNIAYKRFILTYPKTQSSSPAGEWKTHEEELQQLLALLSEDTKVIGVTGDQGIGKSRFLKKISMNLSNDHEVLKVTLEEREAPYQVFRKILMSSSGIKEEDDSSAKRTKLSEHIDSLGNNPQNHRGDSELSRRFPFIAAMLFGMEEEQIKIASYSPELRLENLLDAFRSYLLSRAKEKNLVLLADDLSKADSGSLEMLAFAARTLPRIKQRNIAFVFTFDKGFEQYFKEVFASDGDVKELTLSPLSASKTRELVEQILSGKSDEKVQQFLYERALGNPTVLEQWIGYLQDKSLITKVGETWVLDENVDSAEIPDDLYSLVFSRLDRLPEKVREALKVGSVYGMHFPAPIVSYITENNNLSDLLLPAVTSGLVYPLEAGEIDYIFNQTLIRDVCYDSLLRGEREKYHRQVARAIENLYKSSLDRYLTLLSHHYSEANEWEQAFAYSIRSAKENRRLFRNEAAEIDLTNAIRIWNEHLTEGYSEDLYTAYFCRAQVYEYQGRFDEAAKDYTSARNLSIRTGMREREIDTLNKLAYVSRFISDFDHLFEYADQALTKSSDLGYKRGLTVAHVEKGAGYARQGRHEEADGEFQAALDLAQEINDTEETNRALNNLATLNRFLGQPDKSLEYYQKAVTLAEKNDDKLLLTTNILNLARLLLQLGKIQEAESYLERALKSAIEIGHRENIIKCIIELAGVYLMKGDLNSAHERLEEASVRAEELQNPELAAEVELNRGHIFYYMNKPEDALSAYEHALELRKIVGEPNRIADAHAHVGNTLHMLAKLNDALPHLEEAHKIFSEIGNPQGAARALATLASINRTNGRYIEGFNQIKEAKTLFHESGDSWGEAEATLRFSEAALDFAFYEDAIKGLDFVEETASAPEMVRIKIESQILRSNIYAEMSLPKNGLDAATKAIDNAKTCDAQDLILQSMAARINNLIENKELETAVAELIELQGIAAQTGNVTTALLTAARINLANGMSSSAIDILKQVESDALDKLDSRSRLSLYQLLSQAYYEDNKPSEAALYAEKVISLTQEPGLLWFVVSSNLIITSIISDQLKIQSDENGEKHPSFLTRLFHPLACSKWNRHQKAAVKAANDILSRLSGDNIVLMKDAFIKKGIAGKRLQIS